MKDDTFHIENLDLLTDFLTWRRQKTTQNTIETPSQTGLAHIDRHTKKKVVGFYSQFSERLSQISWLQWQANSYAKSESRFLWSIQVSQKAWSVWRQKNGSSTTRDSFLVCGGFAYVICAWFLKTDRFCAAVWFISGHYRKCKCQRCYLKYTV